MVSFHFPSINEAPGVELGTDRVSEGELLGTRDSEELGGLATTASFGDALAASRLGSGPTGPELCRPRLSGG